MPSQKIIYLTLLCFALSVAGCVKTPAPLATRTAADEKFIKICKEEFRLEPKITPLEKTLWIYLPVETPIFDFKASDAPPPSTGEQPKPAKKFSLQFFEGSFAGQTFTFEYDIIPSAKQAKNPGYGNSYSEEFTKAQNNLLTAVVRSYLDLENKDDIPLFFVLVIADIKKGIEIQMTFNMDDFKRYMGQTLPPDEYLKRYLSDSKGDKAIIEDKEGTHLQYKEVVWTEFLTRQVEKRVQYKYQQSDFPPGEDAENEILKAVGETMRAYDFTAFAQVRLRDLRNSKEFLFDISQLPTFAK